MADLFARRFGAVYLLAALFVCIATLTRLALLLHTPDMGLSVSDLIGIFGLGLLYDAATAAYFAIPLTLYLIFLPERFFRSPAHRWLLDLGFLLSLYTLLFVALSEWVFWDEFQARFNFIAVDYLVYTNEVLGNIWESYPVPTLLAAVGAITLLLFVPLRSLWRTRTARTGLRRRLAQGLALLAIPVLAATLLDSSLAAFSSNRYANELAADGIYNFFAAFRNNELDYRRFYTLNDEQRMLQHLRGLLAEPGTRFVSDDPDDITRSIVGRGPERRLNVVLITVESLSAEFLGIFGSNREASPYLDALAKESLLFTNVYATGTRTDRGLEAISLSVPPTPGRSIVKRPHNEGMFSLGQVFRDHGYATRFLYGGYGYFDNMNYFFAHNGFDVVDRNDIAAQDIHFANIWGVADEDLYTRTLQEIDRVTATGNPFFGLVMTTSNHRPYTYPDGRIDIPSPGGRTGAVKYTDYAIHDFIERARRKPWFDDTLFVIVADHCAKSAGKEALTVAKYHIPLLIYSPKHIAPGRVERLVSQMDLAPTLLGLLNFSYDSRFFGKDVLAPEQPDDAERALIGNYQKLGYMQNGEVVVLTPRRQVEAYRLDAHNRQELIAEPDPQLLEDAIAYYQGASLLYRHRLQSH